MICSSPEWAQDWGVPWEPWPLQPLPCCLPCREEKEEKKEEKEEKEISKDFSAMSWEVWGSPSPSGCPQKVSFCQCNVPLVLLIYRAALKPQLHANAQSQAAFCIGISRKFISAPCQMWMCGRALAFTHWAGPELLIRRRGCQDHPEGGFGDMLCINSGAVKTSGST